jgi:hypothetical protein
VTSDELLAMCMRGEYVTEELQRFLAVQLSGAGLCNSDGVSTVRLRRSDDAGIALSGTIWEVDDQSLHGFWFVLDRDGDGRVRWTLHFDPFARTERLARNVIDAVGSPEEVTWRAVLGGGAEVREGALVPL